MLANISSGPQVSDDSQTPGQIAAQIAFRLRSKRKELRLSQSALAEQSGVSLGSLKRFERDSLISLDSLIRLSCALGCQEEVSDLFTAAEPAPPTLEDMVAQGHSLLDQIVLYKEQQASSAISEHALSHHA